MLVIVKKRQQKKLPFLVAVHFVVNQKTCQMVAFPINIFIFPSFR